MGDSILVEGEYVYQKAQHLQECQCKSFPGGRLYMKVLMYVHLVCEKVKTINTTQSCQEENIF